MTNDSWEQEKPYWAREVSDLLDISDSTLRKYCLILEEKGYTFLRGDNGRRAFLDRDVIALRKFKELSQSQNVTLEDAAIAVVSMLRDGYVTSVTLAATRNFPDENRYVERFNEWENKLDLLIRYNEQRDEDYKRILAENELLRNQIAATSDKLDTIGQQVETVLTETRAERHRPKSFWSRMFGK